MTNLEWVAQEARKTPGLFYLGSPYSLFPAGIEEAWKEVSGHAGSLVARRVPIYCPISHSHPISVFGKVDPFSHEIWMEQDSYQMTNCVGLIVCKMQGWEQSVGMKMEIDAFTKAGKPILPMDV